MVETPSWVTLDMQSESTSMVTAFLGPEVKTLKLCQFEASCLHVPIGCFSCRVQTWRAQKATWHRRLWKENLAEPKQMCGAAAVCYCTCSTAVSHGRDTTPVGSTLRWSIAEAPNFISEFLFIKRWFKIRLFWPQIANEPPPLREIPGDCSRLTAEVLKAGLQKDPVKRSSACDLRVKTDSALKQGKIKSIHHFYC